MKNKFSSIGSIQSIVVIFLVVISILGIGACDNGIINNGDDPITPAPNVLRAIPVAASNSTPMVLDSYTENDQNYYLIYVGHILDSYVSTILIGHFNGVTPVSLTRTTVNTNTVTEAMVSTVSNSITITDTQSHTAGVSIGTAWEKRFPIVGKFSAKLDLHYEWNGSWTNSETDARSMQTSVETAQSFADSLTTSITIGGNGEAEGYHRYAMYSVSDVYFVIITSSDNQQLLSWDTVIGTRDNFLPRMEYCPEGKFDNSPTGNLISFEEDFFINLPKPTISGNPEKKTYTETFAPGPHAVFWNLPDHVEFPATIEIYALGAGGGGQGGFSSSYLGGWWSGTGGAGGGGAAAYMKFDVEGEDQLLLIIDVGRGGLGGDPVNSPVNYAWLAGYNGTNGGNTTVSWQNRFNLIVIIHD